MWTPLRVLGQQRRRVPARLSLHLEESQTVNKPRNKEFIVSEVLSATKKIKEEDVMEC